MIAASTLFKPMIRSLGRGKLPILIYHRVLREPDPIFTDAVDAQRFDAQMRWLTGLFKVIALGEGVDLLQKGSLPPGAACVTFDDGYADNAEVALPILLRHKV